MIIVYSILRAFIAIGIGSCVVIMIDSLGQARALPEKYPHGGIVPIAFFACICILLMIAYRFISKKKAKLIKSK
jgi:uncharacterized BrkB/YihY/UPF0761 family membrane protein